MNPAEPQRALRQTRTLAALLGLLLVITLTPASTLTTDNPVVVENQQPGTDPWIFSHLADDATGQIKGYASATSVRANDNLTFFVTVNPAQTFTIDFFRIGWYAGAGGRLRLHVDPIAGVQQPPCPTDATTGLIACSWTPSYTLTVPSDWTSGVYTARLTNQQGFQNYVIFVVRDGRPASFLYQQSVTTDEAYNNYPNDGVTGKSLYAFQSYGANTVSGNPSAVKVSFDRPRADAGVGAFIKWELNLIRWLERSGYDVTYSTDIDTHTNGGELLNHKAFFSTGHSEYWSKEMYDAAETARDRGVHLAFFGANEVYTQVRFEPSAAGVPNRVVVEYRSYPWAITDPVQGPTTTTEFRQPPVSRPEQTLTGVMFNLSLPNSDFVVSNSSHWMYAGTGFRDGDVVPGILGYEADSFLPNYPPPNSTNQTLLSRSPFTDNGVTTFSNSSIYKAPSGAWVFSAGTMSWSWALDDVPGPLSHLLVDARIQRATTNLLNAFLNGPPPTIASITPAIGAAGVSVTINGSDFTGATAVAFNGSAATFTVISDSAIQTTVPAAATTGALTVTGPGGTTTSSTTFTVAPAITSFTPTFGAVGTSVTISGTGFGGATAVAFNGSAASFTVTSASAIQATVPAGATSGPLRVTTPGGTATSANNFVVAPTITGFTPASGPVGTVVTINGTNFSGATAVRFGGLSAASFTVTSATAIQVTVPAGAATGALSVTTPGGTATSTGNFTVTVALTVSKSSGPLGLGTGTVTSSPAGINCGANCSAFYGTGSVVTLTATPDTLSVFNGWTGCDTVSGAVCTVTMSRARSVAASFLP